MKIIEFLLPKAFSDYCFRMPAGLPKASCSIRDGLITKYLAKALWTILTAMIAQLPAGELAKVGQGSRHTLRLAPPPLGGRPIRMTAYRSRPISARLDDYRDAGGFDMLA